MKVVLFILTLLQSFLFANSEIITITNGEGSRDTFSQRVYEYESGRPPYNKCVHSAGATAINIRVGAKIVNDESAWNYFSQDPFNVKDSREEGLMSLQDWMNSGNRYNIPALNVPTSKIVKFTTQNNFLATVKKYIALNQPLVIALDWYGATLEKNTDGYMALQEYSKEYGHAVTIVGYIKDKNLIAIRDPYISNNNAKENNKYYLQFDYVISLDNLFKYLQTKQLLPFNTKFDAILTDTKTNQLVVFKDINYETTNKLHKNAITYLKEKKIVKGYDDDTFRPNNKITRSEFLKILLLSKHNQSDIKFENNNFEDSRNHWANKYINFAYEHKIITGYEDGSFRPNNNITFSEAAVIIVKLFKIDKEYYWNKDDNWYAEYVWRLWNIYKITYQPKIDDVYDKDGEITYDPHHLITRGEMAFMIATVKGVIK